MKRLMISRLIISLSLFGSCIQPAYAETVAVLTNQTTTVDLFTNSTCNATLNTGWIGVKNWQGVAFDVALDHVAATFVSMTCDTCVNPGAGTACGDVLSLSKSVEVIVSTDAATGISTTKQSGWTRAVAADAGFTWIVSRVYAPFLQCHFTCTAGGVNDKLSVSRRNVSP